MSFKLVYYSQQDPQWKADLLGFGDPGDTIGMYGCALTSVAMLISGHGYTETPQTLNQKLKNKDGFVSSGIRWGVVSQVHSQITLADSVNCEATDAPLARINASLDAGQPVVVRVDSSPAPGLQWHYVMVYARKGADDYLMLDPYPYSPGTTKEDSLMARYSRGNPLKRAIQQVLFYQCSTASGTTGTPQPQPTTDTVSDGARARVKAELTWGLNVRSSPDTSSRANVIASVSAGTELILLDADGASKIGTQQWVRVREPGGKEGFAAAWYLDLVSSGASAPTTEPTPGPVSEAPASTPAPTPAPTQQMDPKKKYLVVSEAAGAGGTELQKLASHNAVSQMHLTPGMLLIVIEPYAKAKGKLGKQDQWIYVRGPNKKLGYVLSQFVKLP
jgi:hypothetical protein